MVAGNFEAPGLESLEPRLLLSAAADGKDVLVHVNTPEFIVLTGEDSQGRNSMTPLASPMTFTLVTLPQHGTLSGTLPQLTYIPAHAYVGPDTFTFCVDDGTGSSAAATISLDVAPWTAPIGIPEPEFGIHETADAIYGPGYYTYYIDNTNPNATNTNNPKGTAARPRLTIPDPLILTPGDVVLIAGGAYTQVNDNYLTIRGGAHPIVRPSSEASAQPTCRASTGGSISPMPATGTSSWRTSNSTEHRPAVAILWPPAMLTMSPCGRASLRGPRVQR